MLYWGTVYFYWIVVILYAFVGLLLFFGYNNQLLFILFLMITLLFLILNLIFISLPPTKFAAIYFFHFVNPIGDYFAFIKVFEILS